MFTPDELRPLAIFKGIPEEDLEWFCEHGQRVAAEAGERLFERGQPADAMWVVVKGVIQGFEEIGGQWLLVATTHAGEVTGMLPFSRMTHYPRNAVASEPSELLRLDASRLKELLQVSYEVGRRLVAQMSDRVRGDVRLEQQNEKMMSLGRLSAGLAHELNNPAAAVRRAAVKLSEYRARLPAIIAALARHRLGEESLARLESFRTEERRPGEWESGESALDRSEREEVLLEWLEELGVDEPWEAAGTLSAVGATPERLTDLVSELPAEAAGDALRWLSGEIESDRIIDEINAAAGRISELVGSIKTYSHMDRSPAHKPTDLRIGLDSTLTMLGHKVKTKSIRVVRDYQADLPEIPANEGELNQVWTNMIDNALDAMSEGGELKLKAKVNDMWVEIEIVDDGPGIPEDVRAMMFEPFFTTKEVGQGTGLGLGIARRIVATHQGHIEVRSEPGETVMCVRLPIVRTTLSA
jgi:signal transduction histidine kinase